MSSPAMMTCGNCGHCMPLDSARGRGYANCNCGAILQCPRGPGFQSGTLRAVLAIGFLGLATAVVAIARHLH